MNKLSALVVAVGVLLSGSAFATFKVVNSVENSTFTGVAPIPSDPLVWKAASAQISTNLEVGQNYGKLVLDGSSDEYSCKYQNTNGTTPVPTDGKAVYVQLSPSCNYGFSLCCSKNTTSTSSSSSTQQQKL